MDLDFELSDLRPEEPDEPTQLLHTAPAQAVHRPPSREPVRQRDRRWEERYEDERPARLSGGKKAAVIACCSVAAVVVLFLPVPSHFLILHPRRAGDTYPVPDLRGMTVEQARDQADIVNGTFQILEAGSEASDTDVGLIVRQDPDPKTEKKGELPITIQVWVSAGEDVGHHAGPDHRYDLRSGGELPAGPNRGV